jgi:DNA processing protein
MTDETAHARKCYNALNSATQGSYAALAKLHKQCGGNWTAAWKGGDAQQAWDELERHGVALALIDDPGYPALLREIPFPPYGIYRKGPIIEETMRKVAIVGTRKATREGEAIAREFAGELGRHGVMVVSGLALGIDAAAHKGCLEGGGATVAVLGNGLDHMYPATNAPLAKEILQRGGTIMSEYPLGSPPRPFRFLERNRIVSGMSDAVLLIEGPERSGALVTARFALEQDREVFVIPGSIKHPNYRGSLELIKVGARLATEPADILQALGISAEDAPDQRKAADFSEEERAIMSAISRHAQGIDIDKLTELTKLNVQTVTQTVTFLLLKNAVKENTNGYTIA